MNIEIQRVRKRVGLIFKKIQVNNIVVFRIREGTWLQDRERSRSAEKNVGNGREGDMRRG
jgi:hypothetical protein